ncbi:leucine rich repeat variant [Candidatus Vecturithrix granuli]|uniref:Leucine rich repeat variant n=1 Tax=Vecturithrix granuli TaxID=1499967 RepID=A0A081C4T6_VECG1|nr:leucine rich repeat variant [Candidatus Vecturithrix granuli]
MQEIKPFSPQDCINFVKTHLNEIKDGKYSIVVDPAWIPELPQEIISLLPHYSWISKKNIAKTSQDAQILRMLATEAKLQDTNIVPELAVSIAKNKYTPLDILKNLSKHENIYVLRAIASNPNTPSEILENFARYNDNELRQSVARNPNTPERILIGLATDHIDDVRRCVLSNSNISVNVLKTLLNDETRFERTTIAIKAAEELYKQGIITTRYKEYQQSKEEKERYTIEQKRLKEEEENEEKRKRKDKTFKSMLIVGVIWAIMPGSIILFIIKLIWGIDAVIMAIVAWFIIVMIWASLVAQEES